jgi:putative ABC transport system ATP-binding protein
MKTKTMATSSDKQLMLRVRQLSKTVRTQQGTLTILKGLDLEVNLGESLAILGTSGSGKSTLLGLLAGLESASSGEIELAGYPLHRLDEDQRAEARSRLVGFVFQSFQLMPALTAAENVMLPMELNGDPDPRGEARKLLHRVGLQERASHYPAQLSGGEQQRVAIARAFASHPKILFADEPTGNLDSHTGSKIIDLLFQLNAEQQATLILVTHDARLAARCNRRLELEAGCLVELSP